MPTPGAQAAAPAIPIDAEAFNRFEAAVPDAGTLWRGILDSAVRVPSLVIHQAPGVQAAIREAFDVLCAVHRRPDGTLAIPVSVQLTRGRRS